MPMLEMPGSLESQRLPNAVAVVMALKITVLAMSKSEQFREYANEALDWALRSKTEKEREMLIYLAQTWTLAATWNDRPTPHLPALGNR